MTTWSLDPVHSRIGFSIKHLMISSIKGNFGQYDGQIGWDEDDLCLSSVVAHIDPNSFQPAMTIVTSTFAAPSSCTSRTTRN